MTWVLGIFLSMCVCWALEKLTKFLIEGYRNIASVVRGVIRLFRAPRVDLPPIPPLPVPVFPPSEPESYRAGVCPTCGHAAQREYARARTH